MTFKLPKLEYAYDALESHIDAKTMEIHHSKHHQGYVNKLNEVLEGNKDYEDKELGEILADLKNMPEKIRTGVRNSGGGHYNHTLFWKLMSKDGGGEPTGKLAESIDSSFGSFDSFKEEFSKAALTRFGSGWAWLGVEEGGKLVVSSTANQDNPLMKGLVEDYSWPILGLDVWEHAYYLKYQNKRADYVGAWWNVVNWKEISEYFASYKK